MSSVGFDPFAGGEILRVSPTTGPQREIIASAQMSDEANTAFNEGVSLSISGSLDSDLLQKSFDCLVERHDILRATFSRRGNEICLSDRNNFTWYFRNLESFPSQEQSQEIEDLLKNIAISPMNLEEGPLFYAWLIRLSETKHQLIIVVHHLICDGWSFGIMLKELAILYNSNAAPGKLPLADSFFEFAEQNEASQISNLDNDYWQDAFRQVPPLSMDLPLDWGRPPARTFEAARFDYQLSSDLAMLLPKAAGKLKASLVNLVMASYFALLQRLSGNKDIIVGLPVAGQAALNRFNQMGHMVQLLPIRICFDELTSFRELVNKVKTEVLNASEHPNFTFGKLLENLVVDRSRVPLISTIFNIDQPMPDLEFGEAVAKIQSVPRSAENFEIFLNVVPAENSLTFEATYSTALFKKETMASWLEALETLLTGAVENPDMAVGSLPLAKEIPDVTARANDTDLEIAHADLISAFRSQVDISPESIAVISGEDSLSYSQLDDKSSYLARVLLAKGIEIGQTIGICCQRSTDMLVGVLAVLKIGAAYLPLDPEFPQDRLSYMLEDSGASAVIEDDTAPPGVREFDILHVNFDTSIPGSQDLPILPVLTNSPGRVSYIMYTSGSTGKPKGVCVPNRAVINLLDGVLARIGFQQDDKLLAVTTLSFDISVLELFLPLVTGATTVIASNEEVKDGEKLAELIDSRDISIMQATPATWRLLLASEWSLSSRKRRNKLKALCGGESLPPNLASDLFPLVSELWNMYGPTETTVWSSCRKITDPNELITIGKPIANTRTYVLNDAMMPLPVNVPGELYIGGAGVTLGYYNREALTAERFIEHPRYGRIYKTGDMAKVLPDGDIHHLGRLDDQVKLRGFRIELGEIESIIMDCPEVETAAVYLWEPGPEDVRVVACCVPAGGGHNLESAKIRKQIREHLPQYMIPQYLLAVETMPLTPNGKIDRKALPHPEITGSSILAQSILVNETEKVIARIWTDLIHPKSAIGREDNFFEVGGHSLLALEAIRKIEHETGKRFKPADIVAKRLYMLADQVDAESERDDSLQSGPVALSAHQPRTLSNEQMRLLRRQISIPESICNNLPAAWLLTGNLDLNAFKKSMARVWERQTALRTLITERNAEYCQTILHVDRIILPEIFDLSGQDKPLEEALELAKKAAAEAFMPLDNILCRTALYVLGEGRYLFCVTPHQLIFDGWSFDILLTELESNYSAITQGSAPTTRPLSFEFRDFCNWDALRTGKTSEEEYHKLALDNIKPFSGIDSVKSKGFASRHETRFETELMDRVLGFCSRFELRLHELFFAALSLSMCELNDSRDTSVGVPVTGRYTPEVIGLIGGFISVLPCMVKLAGTNRLSQIQDIALQLKEFHNNQDVGFSTVVRDTKWQHPPFPDCVSVSFGFQDIRNRPVALCDLSLSQIDMPRGQTEFPIECWVRIQPDNFIVVLDYDQSQVNEELVVQLSSAISAFLNSLDEYSESSQVDLNLISSDREKRSVWRRLFR